jgi:4'-phosphopantetheinyl transferase
MPRIICSNIPNVKWAVEIPQPLVLTDVHVWRVDIADNLHLLDKCAAVLTEDEQQRANQYHHLHDRQRFILARGILRFLLSRYSRLQAADVRFTIHYNVAHAGNFILITVGGVPVGIDVSHADPAFDYTGILNVCFSDKDATYIQLSPEPLRTFHQFWSRKEALLKATGKGIDDDLKLIPCVDGFHHAPAAVVGCSARWW